MAETNRASETVVIFASPRKNGFTAKLLQEFLKQEGIEDYYLFDCYKEMPLPCIACGKCEKDFACSQSDLKEFGKVFNECRRLIIATPIYNGGLPAPFKALIDRNQVYYSARFSRNQRGIAKEKQAVILATSGSALEKSKTLRDIFLPIFSVTSAKLLGVCSWENTDRGSSMPLNFPSFKKEDE